MSLPSSPLTLFFFLELLFPLPISPRFSFALLSPSLSACLLSLSFCISLSSVLALLCLWVPLVLWVFLPGPFAVPGLGLHHFPEPLFLTPAPPSHSFLLPVAPVWRARPGSPAAAAAVYSPRPAESGAEPEPRNEGTAFSREGLCELNDANYGWGTRRGRRGGARGRAGPSARGQGRGRGRAPPRSLSPRLSPFFPWELSCLS